MLQAQDWCLQCGAGAPGSLAAPGSSWRSVATVLTATVILVLGAAAAGYAALSKGKGPTHARTVAQTTSPLSSAPAAPTTPTTPTTPTNLGTPTTIKPITPLGGVKPPKIPLKAVTPTISSTPITTPATTVTTPTTTTTTPATTGGSTTPTEPQPQPILLDTNAAETYNPKAYPASAFGDPSLTIDGESSTGWTAQVDPVLAPKMAAGLVFNMNTARKLSALKLITTTPGMTVQVFGSNSHTLPLTISDPGWSKLSSSVLAKRRHFSIKLKSTKAFRLVTLWISKVPAKSVGTAQAPGHVSVNEVELFPVA
jgi:hypothetical protein